MVFHTRNKMYVDVLKNDCNKYAGTKVKRNNTFDFARGTAVFFMIIVHVLMIYSSYNVQDSLFGLTVDFLGGPPAAPVFMFSMGVFYMLSSKSSALKSGILRGLKLLLLGTLLSYLRSDIFIFFDSSAQSEFLSTNKLMSIWEVDILQFAGWAYILMSLIRHCFKKPFWWLIIAISIMISSPILWGISSDIKAVSWIFNFLWGTADEVYFPIFGWLFYPLIGMVFGIYVKAFSDIESLFQSLLKPGLFLLLIGSIITATNFDFHIGDYYRSGPGSMVWILGFVFVWLWVSHKTTGKIPQNRLLNILTFWGKNTTVIYIVHWLLISWGTILFGYEEKGYFMTIVLMVLMVVVSHLLSNTYKTILTKKTI